MVSTHCVALLVVLVVGLITVVNYFVVLFPHRWNRQDNNYGEEIAQLEALNKSLIALRQELHVIRQRTETGGAEGSSLQTASVPRSGNTPAQVIEDCTTSRKDAGRTGKIEGERKIPLTKGKAAVIFTMDSISSYEENSLSGGAAGELVVRKSLEYALKALDCSVTTIRSDQQFLATDLRVFDFIILDPWTWAAKGWVPKRNLHGLDERVYILDFFGTKDGLRPPLHGGSAAPRLNVDPKRILTAFGSPDNTFLGYFMPNHSTSGAVSKLRQGVVWGKDAKHLTGTEGVLYAVANHVKLVSTSTTRVLSHHNIEWIGHQSSQAWMGLLQQSRFLVGVGNPILGPSAIDAISVGCMFLNPLYERPVIHNGYAYRSQHPYAERMGPPSVCNYKQRSVAQLKACIENALQSNLSAQVPTEFTRAAHIARVKNVFKL